MSVVQPELTNRLTDEPAFLILLSEKNSYQLKQKAIACRNRTADFSAKKMFF